MSSCKTTFAHTQDGDIIGKTPISQNGYQLEYFLAFHVAPGQNDTASVLLFGPDSVTNKYISDFKNYITTHFPVAK